MLSWVREPRFAGGQDITNGRLLERHLELFGLMDADGSPLAFIEWLLFAQNRALMTKLFFLSSLKRT